VLTIRCAKCKAKIFKYKKIGKGRLLRCWKDRISEDFSQKDGNLIKCVCGTLIGIDEGLYIKMKQGSFTTSGTYSTKL